MNLKVASNEWLPTEITSISYLSEITRSEMLVVSCNIIIPKLYFYAHVHCNKIVTPCVRRKQYKMAKTLTTADVNEIQL